MRGWGYRRENCGSGVGCDIAHISTGHPHHARGRGEEARHCSLRSLPPCGGGSGRGVPHGAHHRFAHSCAFPEPSHPSNTSCMATPLPDPPPQGGREPTMPAARSSNATHCRAAVPLMTGLAALIRRDIRIALRVGGGALIGVLFFLTVVVLMPFAVGPDLALLSRLGPAILWLGALLASLLTLDRLFMADHEDGSLDLIVMG